MARTPDVVPEVQQSSNRLRSLVAISLAKAREETKKKTKNTETRAAQLPKLLKIVDLLRKNQAHERAAELASSRRPQQRTLCQPIRKTDGRFKKNGGDEKAFLQKLSPLDFRAVQERKLDGYCEVRSWFFESPQYAQWSKGKAWHLSCYGEPRCGKTTFAAAVARDIRSRADAEKTAVAVLFLAEEDKGRSLIEDELDQGIPSALLQDLASSHTHTVDITPERVNDYTLAEVAKFDAVFVLIDGLDSLDQVTQAALRVEFARLNTLTHVRLMFIQAPDEVRRPPGIRCNRYQECDGSVVLYWHCKHCSDGDFHLCQACYDGGHRCSVESHVLEEPYHAVEVELRTPPDELVNYIQQRLDADIMSSSDLGRRLSDAQDVVRNVKNTVAAKAAGIFVLAKLYMDYLWEKQSLNETLDVLDGLPQYQTDYFNSLMDEVEEQTDDDRLVALTAMALVASCCWEARPLTFEELADALHDMLGDLADDLTEHKLLQIAKGILTIEARVETQVKPFHMDVSTYLVEECEERFADVGLDMAQLCLESITAAKESFEDVYDQPSTLLEQLNSKPFVRYALQFWGQHLSVSDSPEARDSARQSLAEYEDSPGLQAATFLAFAHNDPWHWWPGSHKLHLCAWFGLGDLFAEERLTADINATDAITERTALHVAVIRGQSAIVTDLLAANADTGRLSKQGRTLLWEAVEEYEVEDGDLSLVNAILEHITPQALNAVNPCSKSETVLLLALRLQKTEIAEVLSQHPDIDLSVQDSHGRTALHFAAQNGNASIVQRIIEQDEGRNLLNRCDLLGHRTPLMLMLEREYWGVEQDDEDDDDDDDAEDTATTTEDPRLMLLKLATQKGADVGVVDESGRNLLHYAAWAEDRLPVFRHLHSMDMNINAKDKDGMTALHYAAVSPEGDVSVVETLLELGADPATTDAQGRTAHRIAVLRGASQSIISALETPSAASDVEPEDSPLWAQILFKAEDFPRTHGDGLAGLPDSVMSQTDPLGFTLLHCAVEARNTQIAQLLLNDGRVDLKATNIYGQTALLMALTDSIGDEKLHPMVHLFLEATNLDFGFDCVDYLGQTALEIALSGLHNDIAIGVLQHCETVSLDQRQMRTLLMRAIEVDSEVAVKKLVEAGADVFICRRGDKLPSQVAEEEGAGARVVQLLRDEECRVLGTMRPVEVPSRVDSGLATD
ncbi:hypothetical protein LTR02_014303 [Friedmanniomyces endolithicus]|nr:hypothetical protein LTR94_018248 [Friedmanniomyces endolithicus]KAK0775541.1 hypothetical protein LTR59_014486 [Friedmanniomyces endolithicus]KAK0786848.1 hypothetical protein LTR75_013066 [Friedmanniomyces endolithicus]KAK0806040.1 hypothetical protein LTR38_005257 [Friedmanniomyces endolithicus]KAK0837703.1 hypothetical protein LTR03_012573 [Friedmanniomyces endolithicus]